MPLWNEVIFVGELDSIALNADKVASWIFRFSLRCFQRLVLSSWLRLGTRSQTVIRKQSGVEPAGAGTCSWEGIIEVGCGHSLGG